MCLLYEFKKSFVARSSKKIDAHDQEGKVLTAQWFENFRLTQMCQIRSIAQISLLIFVSILVHAKKSSIAWINLIFLKCILSRDYFNTFFSLRVKHTCNWKFIAEQTGFLSFAAFSVFECIPIFFVHTLESIEIHMDLLYWQISANFSKP